MNISKESIIGAIVSENYRTAAIFEQAGIDFCCNGNRSIEAACRQQGVDTTAMVNLLQQTIDANSHQNDNPNDYKSWPLDLLADFIEKKHHRYASIQIPVIQTFLEKIVQVHGKQHPELAEIKVHFDACAGELTAHMKREELMLFPSIRKMVQAKQNGEKDEEATFSSIRNPIHMMMIEHDIEGERFSRIKELSKQYTVPPDGCNTYKAAYAELQAFETDLHMHIHLENNILFPKSIELEQSQA